VNNDNEDNDNKDNDNEDNKTWLVKRQKMGLKGGPSCEHYFAKCESEKVKV